MKETERQTSNRIKSIVDTCIEEPTVSNNVVKIYSIRSLSVPNFGTSVARHRIKARGVDPNPCFVKPAIVSHCEVLTAH
ncbi:hypothetical protein CsSME_00044733 [Camellia sinensis var. sinensis]